MLFVPITQTLDITKSVRKVQTRSTKQVKLSTQPETGMLPGVHTEKHKRDA